MKKFFMRGLLCAALAVAAAAGAPASAASAQALHSGLLPFLPPPPSGYQSPTPPVAVEDLNGMEPSAHQAYGSVDPQSSMGFGVTIVHLSPEDLDDAIDALSEVPVGPHPMAPWMVTSHVKVNGLDAYLSYNDQGPGGVLQMRVGRVLVGVSGSGVTPEAIIGLAGSMDTAALQKY